MTLARACRDAVRVRFQYAGHPRGGGDGEELERTVEPVRMVATGRRWYLLAYDLTRDDWRTFRLDRMRDVTATTWRFRPREHPDPSAFVQRSVTASPYRYVAKVRLHAEPEDVRALVPPQVARVDDDPEPGWSRLTSGGDDLGWLAMHIARLGFEAEVLEPPELKQAAARLAERLTEMAES